MDKEKTITKEYLKTNAITARYFEKIESRKMDLFFKFTTDKLLALILLVLLSPIIITLSIWIKLDSKGPIFYRQERVTRYGRIFRIFKFR